MISLLFLYRIEGSNAEHKFPVFNELSVCFSELYSTLGLLSKFFGYININVELVFN
jgi:hypothetical protein